VVVSDSVSMSTNPRKRAKPTEGRIETGISGLALRRSLFQGRCFGADMAEKVAGEEGRNCGFFPVRINSSGRARSSFELQKSLGVVSAQRSFLAAPKKNRQKMNGGLAREFRRPQTRRRVFE